MGYEARNEKTARENLAVKSGRHDSNVRPLRPERSALARLSYAPIMDFARSSLRRRVNVSPKRKRRTDFIKFVLSVKSFLFLFPSGKLHIVCLKILQNYLQRLRNILEKDGVYFVRNVHRWYMIFYILRDSGFIEVKTEFYVIKFSEITYCL